MQKYYIDLGRESSPQIRELTNEEYNLISSIFEEAQNGMIEEYPFDFNDILKVYGELCQLNRRDQREKLLWKTLYKRYENINPEVLRYFVCECENYYNRIVIR